ncbi:DUF3105 domain-containing protein [Micromonospora sp. NPDC048830]|uniref:DUF3105 domain-containing protein n=1 Tax=Micromonospora sp. NPDC048830 TaxID=3364257 RepID=UPI00370F97D4
MSRRWLGTLVSVVVTTLSVLTMSSLGFGVVLGLADRETALPCGQVPGTPVPSEGDRHIAYEGAPHEPYRTMPPTSGPHSPRVITPGIYREPVLEELQVHALEHGHIMLQYAPDVSAADVTALERIGRRYPRDVVVAPYPALGHGIGLSGWQRLQRLDTLDERAITAFVTKVAGRYDHSWRHGATDCAGP